MTPHEQALDVACNHAIFVWENSGMTRATIASAIRAYLRARREIDGAVMCVVPEKYKTTIADDEYVRGVMVGFNVCVATTLASAEAHDADV